jgi:hypothetical protein
MWDYFPQCLRNRKENMKQKANFISHLICEWVLRRIFGPKRDGVTGGWRKLHKEELHKLYSSPSIIRIIKSRRMK